MRNREFLFFKKLIRYLIIFIIIFLLIQPILAFRYFVCRGDKVVWDSDPDHLRASTVSFPSGSSFRTALGEVINQFNTNPSSFRFNVRYDEDHVNWGGTKSEIWFSSDFDLHNGNPAATNIRKGCNHIWTTDIVFNTRLSWIPGTNKSLIRQYGGDRLSFRAILMHELGHAMGLYHEGREYNVMGQSSTNIHAYVNYNDVNGYLGEDASDGAAFLYGQGHNREDLSVTHWKWVSEIENFNGNISEHDRTEIRWLNNRQLPSFIDSEGPEPVYMVPYGITYDLYVEVTLENNGSSTHDNVRVGYYISNNQLITTHDRRIGGFNASLGRNQVWTTTRTMTIPHDLRSRQTYYIGIIVDETDEIEEVNETNNATYIAGIWPWGPLP